MKRDLFSIDAMDCAPLSGEQGLGTLFIPIALLWHEDQRLATNLPLTAPKTKKLRLAELFKLLIYKEIPGRGERIRTSGLYVPNVALYQAKLHPDDCR